jgi:DNA anti-recombination protein RmuC
MTWLATKLFFQKALLWCKKYWQILLGISIPLVIWFLTAGRNNELKKVLEKTKENHKRDVEALEKSHEDELEAKRQEIRAKEVAAAELARRISEIESEYNVSRSNLSRHKKKELDKLLDVDTDPAEVSNRLADIFGVDVKS